jgi:hypothetical protein
MCTPLLILLVWIASMWVCAIPQGRGWTVNIDSGAVKLTTGNAEAEKDWPLFHLSFTHLPDAFRDWSAGFQMPSKHDRVFCSSGWGTQYVLPLWVPLAVSAIPSLWLAERRYGRYQRVPKGCCEKCRYDLTGNLSGICPECGSSIPDAIKSELREREEASLSAVSEPAQDVHRPRIHSAEGIDEKGSEG